MIEEAAIPGGVRTGRVLRRGPEELERLQRAVGGLGAGDPAVLHADRVGGERESDGGDARERRGGPAVGGEAVGCRRQVPEEVERAVLQGVEKGSCVWRDARAPGVSSTASEGQGKDDSSESTSTSGQKLYSTPICTRRGSLTTWRGC